ncbi:uncharacterized protein L969DRAFT_44948 [Mixia osmundae IAM 14324]|uniref:Carbohydrate-binding module family 19 domain-containing protein n=1 Tax=Mixia osmundae (strain CBS 9802 / IAM 14324 / JCM 22182 / KY 12970) TaxID=764103 RepID=G7DTX7_MIXOS|nr:uncharacterized protein L969DRAFT_44948 [Mixia osmundae IAM 14324]KEI41750.1 hypothetical protein L969DRAFT_44948 [Mixia osmundae IAM 14324]GAA94037.1 hypothetical protein E5Q_00684 [Mixia osmundae IAM 14324]
MTKPYPFRSKFDPDNQASQNIDWTNTAPLMADGSNFPCKGYLSDLDRTAPKDTLTAGQTYTTEFAGTATHGGGSCQWALSYDEGRTFAVIHSVIGGCPLASSYAFVVPSDAPASTKAVLSWTWFNRLGNREMYQNCAVVAVKNPRQASTWSGPAIAQANIFGSNCIAPEGTEFVYPNPGKSTVYGGSYVSGAQPKSAIMTSCSFDFLQNVLLTAPDITGGMHQAQATSSAARKNHTLRPRPQYVKPILSSTRHVSKSGNTTKQRLRMTKIQSTRRPTSVALPKACSYGGIRCISKGYAFTMCSNGKEVNMGSVAFGTKCVNGAIMHE